MPHNPQHFVPILTRDEREARRLARQIKEQPNVFERIGRLPFPGGGTFEQAAGGLGRIVEAVSAPFSLAGAITGAVTSGKPNEAREIDELFGQMVRGKISPPDFAGRLIEKQRAKPLGEQLVTELPAMFFQPVRAVKEATGAFKGAVKAAETVTGVPLRPSMRRAVAARPAGAAIRRANDPALRELDQQLLKVNEAIRTATSTGAREALPSLEDTRGAIEATRNNVLENLMGQERFARYQAALTELDEARAIFAGTRERGGAPKAPLFGTPERSEWEAARRRLSEAGRPLPSKMKTADKFRARLKSLRVEIEDFESAAYKARVPAAEEAPAQAGGVMQKGMGIGERPPQGGLFEGLRGEAERIPLADAEQISLRQARAAEIARGQREMLRVAEAPRVPESPVAPPRPVPPAAPAAAKEPWEMTQEELRQSIRLATIRARDYKASVSEIDGAMASVEPEIPGAHYRAVQRALSEGKPVPAEVLKDYPDLAARPAGAAGKKPLSQIQQELEQELSRRAQAGERMPVALQGGATPKAIKRYVESFSEGMARDWHSGIFRKRALRPGQAAIEHPIDVPPVQPAQAVPEQAVSAPVSAADEALKRALFGEQTPQAELARARLTLSDLRRVGANPRQIENLEGIIAKLEKKAARAAAPAPKRALRRKPSAPVSPGTAPPVAQWAYHKTTKEALTSIRNEGMTTGDFTSGSVIDFPGDTTIRVKTTNIPNPQIGEYGQGIKWYLPNYEAGGPILPEQIEVLIGKRWVSLQSRQPIRTTAPSERALRRKPVSQEPRAPSPPSASQPRVPPQAAEARPSLVEAEAPLERGGRTPQGPPPKTPIAEGAPPIPPEEPVSKLLGLIKAAKPVRAETEALKHEDLRRRAAILASAQERATGEAAVLRARGVLKGELPKAEFDPPAAGLSQAERDTLFDAITNSPLRPFERLPVEDGLVKVLNGQVPTIGEIEGLERVFGKEMAQALLSKRPWTEKALEQILDAVNLPKAFRFGFDLSFSLRQAGPFLTVQTFRPYLRMFRDQAKALLRKDLAESLQAAREAHPKYGFAKDAGLEITEVGAARLSRREELWASGLLGKLAKFRLPTGAGKVATTPVRLVFGGAEASQRAFVEAGNNIRFGVFTQEVNRVERSGLEYSLESAKRLSRFLNWTTGRGPLGGAERTKLGPLLNAVFTAPRFVTSRFAVPTLGAVETARTVGALARLQRPDPASAFIARQMSEWMARNIALLVLLDKSGLAKVEWDPRSSDWGKITIAGEVRIDPWSGFQQAARFLANLATKQRKPLAEKGVQPVQPGDVLFQFFRSKLSPSVSAAADLWTGKDVTGQPASLLGEAAELFLPITADDILEASEELGVWPGAALAPLTVLGAGTQVFDPTERTTSRRGKRATLEDLQDALRDDELESTLDELDRSLRTKLREAVPAGR